MGFMHWMHDGVSHVRKTIVAVKQRTDTSALPCPSPSCEHRLNGIGKPRGLRVLWLQEVFDGVRLDENCPSVSPVSDSLRQGG